MQTGYDGMTDNYEVEIGDKSVFILLKGDFIMAQTRDMMEIIDSDQVAGGKQFIFDLSPSKWLDSFGIKCLVMAKRVSEKPVILIHCNRKIRSILHSVGISSFVEYQESSDQVNSLR